MPKSKVGWHLSQDEMKQLESAEGGIEFAIVKIRIKAARGGELPPDWFDFVIGSGMIDNKINQWGGKESLVLHVQHGTEEDD